MPTTNFIDSYDWDGYATNATFATARNQAAADTFASQATVCDAGSELSGGLYYVYRSGLAFDTSSISGATISSGTVNGYCDIKHDDDTATLYVLNGTWPNPSAAADWDLFSYTSGGTLAFSSITVGAYNNVSLNATGLGFVTQGGTTKVTLVGSNDFDNSAPVGADWIRFRSGTQSNPPTLTLTYTLPSPDITSITPSSADNNGSVSITNLAGTSLTGASPTVKLTKSGQTDISATSVVQVSATQVTCTIALAGAATGTWDVVYTDSNGTDTLTNGFTVVDGTPAPTSILPATGTNDGTVTITALAGTNFTGTTQVKLSKSGESDIIMTSLVVSSDVLITGSFDLTGAAIGTWDVVISNPGGTGTMSNGFSITEVAAADTATTSIYFNRQTVERQTPLAGVTANVIGIKFYNNTKGQGFGLHELGAIVRPTGVFR